MKRYADSNERDFNRQEILLLIPSQFVTKVIGMGGSHIQHIQKKTGAVIKVHSKKDDMHSKAVAVTIKGSADVKY